MLSGYLFCLSVRRHLYSLLFLRSRQIDAVCAAPLPFYSSFLLPTVQVVLCFGAELSCQFTVLLACNVVVLLQILGEEQKTCFFRWLGIALLELVINVGTLQFSLTSEVFRYLKLHFVEVDGLCVYFLFAVEFAVCLETDRCGADTS